MKAVFKCDYCVVLAPEEECKEHEKQCVNNPSNKTCYTCRHGMLVSGGLRGCLLNIELDCKRSFYSHLIPKVNCQSYENGNPSNEVGV